MKFKIEWANGRVEEVEQKDCSSVEQFINVRFGSAGARDHKVTVAGVEQPAPIKKPAKKKVTDES